MDPALPDLFKNTWENKVLHDYLIEFYENALVT